VLIDGADVEALARVDAIGERAVVGEAGAALSGGERQRVTIVHALLKPAPALLVDEATSALDTEDETAIARAVAEDPSARTRVVAHRLSSVKEADLVLFLDNGRLAEQGGFAELWRHHTRAAAWRIG
jgi:ATP-binding cassette subfamily B protein IrtB